MILIIGDTHDKLEISNMIGEDTINNHSEVGIDGNENYTPTYWASISHIVQNPETGVYYVIYTSNGKDIYNDPMIDTRLRQI